MSCQGIGYGKTAGRSDALDHGALELLQLGVIALQFTEHATVGAVRCRSTLELDGPVLLFIQLGLEGARAFGEVFLAGLGHLDGLDAAVKGADFAFQLIESSGRGFVQVLGHGHLGEFIDGPLLCFQNVV